MGKFRDWLNETFTADAIRRQRMAGEVEDAGELLIDEAAPHYVATVMEAAASKALRLIERDTLLCEKRPELLTYYRAALEAARNLQQAYKDIKEIEAAGEEEIAIDDQHGLYAHLSEPEDIE